MTAPVDALVYYVVFVFSVSLHEAAHAWAAMVGGDLTAYRGGQVSLDPIPHIRREPFGMVLLPLLTVFLTGWPFGFASAPYDPLWAARHPKRAAWMSLAGPGSNLGLVLISGIVLRLGLSGGWFSAPGAVSFGEIVSGANGETSAAGYLLGVIFSMNLVLLLLNMIPLPPLDGSGALPLLLPERAIEPYRNFISQPMLGWIGILVAWKLFSMVYHPIFLFAVNLLHPAANYG